MDSPKPPASPPPPATTTAPGNHHALDNLKSLLMKCAIASTPAKSLTLPQKTFIEKRIQDFFPTIHTPDHPPYAWLILLKTALCGLKHAFDDILLCLC
ncbi:UNVERIFIED_CONTAM: hypothetical protein Sindi_1242000 [Sesamum indicum]